MIWGQNPLFSETSIYYPLSVWVCWITCSNLPATPRSCSCHDFHRVTVDGSEIPQGQPPGMCKTLQNNGINYQPQLVSRISSISSINTIQRWLDVPFCSQCFSCPQDSHVSHVCLESGSHFRDTDIQINLHIHNPIYVPYMPHAMWSFDGQPLKWLLFSNQNKGHLHSRY